MENDVKFYEGKLSPCPFCGDRARIEIDEKENSDTTHITHIRCADTYGCGASIFGCVSFYAFGEHMQELIDKWNTRGINKKENRRKEIAREFLNKSDIAVYDELVDWVASEGPKIWEAWQEAGAI